MDNATTARLPSDRKFGITFTILLSILAAFAAVNNLGWMACGAALIGSAIIGAITLTVPSKLRTLNEGWFYVGELMGKIVSPVVLGLIFFGLLTPISLATRLFGRDELRLRSRAAGSYWIRRDTTGSTGDSFRNQF
jgi:Saxitoxin biosynthesis operon protein SxtJ